MAAPIMTGRGLWFGARTFSLEEWKRSCEQAHAWGIQVIHPKMAEGGYLWYDSATMEKLRDMATYDYHLHVVPYHFCYGDYYGALAREAEITATLGIIFGGVSPDMEDAWANHDDWARTYGRLVRDTHAYHGPVYPTVYANPEQHPTPIATLNEWVDGFLPQVYFSVWYPQTAENAITYFQPQWKRIEEQLAVNHQILKPILPIISLGKDLPPSEVTTWLQLMQHYGYCGFWYDGEYIPYAETILRAPLPAFMMTAPQKKDTSMATIDQNLSIDDLHTLWSMNKIISWKPESAIGRLWTVLIQNHPEINIGAPTEEEAHVTIAGEEVIFITFTSGRRIIYFKKDGKTCVY